MQSLNSLVVGSTTCCRQGNCASLVHHINGKNRGTCGVAFLGAGDVGSSFDNEHSEPATHCWSACQPLLQLCAQLHQAPTYYRCANLSEPQTAKRIYIASFSVPARGPPNVKTQYWRKFAYSLPPGKGQSVAVTTNRWVSLHIQWYNVTWVLCVQWVISVCFVYW